MRYSKKIITLLFPPVISLLAFFTFCSVYREKYFDFFMKLAEKNGARHSREEKSLRELYKQINSAPGRDHELQDSNNDRGFIHLFQQIVTYENMSERRKEEYLNTFQLNVNHPFVRSIYVLEETWKERDIYENYIFDIFGKVKFIPFGRQPLYSDIFRIVSAYIVPHLAPGDVWMISNSDIILGKGFGQLRHSVNNKTFLTLSRHTKFCGDINRCFQSKGRSMDSFIGSALIPRQISDFTNFLQNRYGAENVIAFYFRKYGFTVVNPCLNVITIHNHCSNEKPWTSNKSNIKRVDNFTIHGILRIEPSMWPPDSTQFQH